jgi:hypothetical protein
MKTFRIVYKAGPGVDLEAHLLHVTANSMAEAHAVIERKLGLRFPHYRILNITPVVEEELVERLRAER